MNTKQILGMTGAAALAAALGAGAAQAGPKVKVFKPVAGAQPTIIAPIPVPVPAPYVPGYPPGYVPGYQPAYAGAPLYPAAYQDPYEPVVVEQPPVVVNPAPVVVNPAPVIVNPPPVIAVFPEAPTPDLVVGGYTIGWERDDAGRLRRMLTFRVKNIGTAIADPSLVAVTLGEDPTTFVGIPALLPNQDFDAHVETAGPIRQGTLVRIVVDARNRLPELDKKNNQLLTRYFTRHN
jgi:hypothetical protein